MSGMCLVEDFGFAFNACFLREVVALDDFDAPPKTVFEATCDRTGKVLRQICAPVDEAPIVTTIETAEMVKYVDNVWHATKVCFATEVGRLAKSQGEDGHAVMDIFCQDQKLNLSPYYLKPGFAYGGSCLPKEVRAVAHIAKGAGVSLPMIENLGTSNQAQIDAAIQMVRDTGAQRVGVLGLAFKPGTDDLRESPILAVIAALRDEGITVVAHDPAITPDTNIAAQLAYVRHASRGLTELDDALPGMVAPTPEAVHAECDAVIVTQANATYSELLRNVLSEGKTPVIDVVRTFAELPESRAYAGIGW